MSPRNWAWLGVIRYSSNYFILNVLKYIFFLKKEFTIIVRLILIIP